MHSIGQIENVLNGGSVPFSLGKKKVLYGDCILLSLGQTEKVLKGDYVPLSLGKIEKVLECGLVPLSLDQTESIQKGSYYVVCLLR